MTVQQWSTTASDNNSAPPTGAPEGMAAAAVNNTMREMMASVAIDAQVNRVKYLNSVAGTNTITGSMTPALTAYSAGMIVVFTPANNCTGATTININSLGALDIQKGNAAALVSGDLVAGIPAVLVLDSGADDWTLLNPQSNTYTSAQTAGPPTSPIYLTSTAPAIGFNDTNSTANSRLWDIIANSDQFNIRASNDAVSVVNNAISISAASGVVSAINLQGTAVQTNGVDVTASNGSFTATLTGYASNPTGTLNYTKIGSLVTLYANSNIDGTSNATTMTITGLPAAIRPTGDRVAVCHWTNGGVATRGQASLTSGSGTITAALDGSLFSSSGTKGLGVGWLITYSL